MMAEVDGTLILEILRKIQADISDIKHDYRELKLRVAVMDGQMTMLTASVQLINERADRMDEKLERIERRLELVDAH